jgi:hypothetical protein
MVPIMQIVLTVWLALSFFFGIQPQEFKMEKHKPLFSKLIQVKYFYKDKSAVNKTEKQKEMIFLSKKFSFNIKTTELEKIYYELHIKPHCHKFLKNIDSNTWISEMKANESRESFSDMAPWSGQLLTHVANIHLRELTLTKERYDIDIAMILKKPGSQKYIYYLPKCADTSLPFNYLH